MKILPHRDTHFNREMIMLNFSSLLIMKCYYLSNRSIRIDKELHVRLFFKGSPVPLPQWFRHGRGCRLIHKSMLENFSAYLLSQNEKFDSIFEELREFKFKKRPVYSASIIQFVLLRYTSRRSYRILQKDFLLPSIPLLKKICSGAIDAVHCDQTLKNEGKIFGNVCLLFSEIPTNTPRGFHVETTWKRLCVCRDVSSEMRGTFWW